MLRMSKLADYAFVILSKMAIRPEESFSAPTLAQATALPLPTVAKLMKLLARGEVVVAQRGATGGYRLARPCAQISIVSVLEIVDGPIQLTECADGNEKACTRKRGCTPGGDCRVCANWQKLNTSVRNALSAVTLSDLVGASP